MDSAGFTYISTHIYQNYTYLKTITPDKKRGHDLDLRANGGGRGLEEVEGVEG